MTIKRKKIYEIIIISLVIMFTSLCAYMGITAVQKSMKLNLSFTANPIVFCQVLVNEEVIFDNSEKIIDDGVSLSGNVLTFNSTVSENVTLGESFDLQIKNYSTTGSAIHISFNGATISTGDVVNSTSYSEIIASNNFSEVLSVSTNEMRISMTKVTPVTLSLGAGVTLTSSNILTSTSGAQCLPFGEDLQATISLESSYENPKFTFNGNTYDITNNQLTIPAEDLTGGNTNVEVEAEQSGYTITFNANGGTFTSGTTITQTLEENAVYLAPEKPTKTDYFFAGWAETSTATSATWVSGEQTATAEKTWYAVWLQYYDLTVNFTGDGRTQNGNGTFFVFATNDPEFSFYYDKNWGAGAIPGCCLKFTNYEEIYNEVNFVSELLYLYKNALNKGLTINEQLPNSPYLYIEPTIGLGNGVNAISARIPVGFKVLIGIGSAVWGGYDNGTKFAQQPTSSVELSSVVYDSNSNYSYTFKMPSSNATITAETSAW